MDKQKRNRNEKEQRPSELELLQTVGDRFRSSRKSRRLHPSPDAFFEKFEWSKTVENTSVKILQFKLPAKFLLHRSPHAFNFYFAGLVGGGLAGPRDVPVNLGLHEMLAQSRVAEEVVDSLLPSPAHGVYASVYDHPGSPDQVEGVKSDQLVRIVVVQHQLMAEIFGVESPTLDE